MKNTLLNSTINEYIFPMTVLKTFDFFTILIMVMIKRGINDVRILQL